MNPESAISLAECREFLRLGNYLHDNPPDLQRLSVAIYRQLAKGHSVSKNELAQQLHISPEQIHRFLKLVPVTAIEFDRTGNISGFVGLSLKAGNHRFIVNSYPLFTWCVLDALFLPSILQADATLLTECPESGQTIEVFLSPCTVLSSNCPSPVVSLTSTDQNACRNDLRASFCNHVNLFSDFSAFEKWRRERPDVIGIALSDAYDLAVERNGWRYPGINWKAPALTLNGAVKI